jgi:hypothetical protein
VQAEHDDGNFRHPDKQLGRGRDAVDAGHRYVHHHHIRPEPGDLDQRGVGITRLPDYGQVILETYPQSQPSSGRVLIIDHEDSYHAAHYFSMFRFRHEGDFIAVGTVIRRLHRHLMRHWARKWLRLSAEIPCPFVS